MAPVAGRRLQGNSGQNTRMMAWQRIPSLHACTLSHTSMHLQQCMRWSKSALEGHHTSKYGHSRKARVTFDIRRPDHEAVSHDQVYQEGLQACRAVRHSDSAYLNFFLCNDLGALVSPQQARKTAFQTRGALTVSTAPSQHLHAGSELP